jgi:hypothetical protein
MTTLLFTIAGEVMKIFPSDRQRMMTGSDAQEAENEAEGQPCPYYVCW